MALNEALVAAASGHVGYHNEERHAFNATISAVVNASMSTATIQAALTGCTPGGRVLFEPGLYQLTATLSLPNYVSVTGPGAVQPFTGDAPVLTAAAGFNGDLMVNAGVDDAAGDYWMHGTQITNLVFRGRIGQTAGSGIRCVPGEDALIANCVFVMMPDAGIRFAHYVNGVQQPANLAPANMHNIDCYGNNVGVWFDYCKGSGNIVFISGDNNKAALVKISALGGTSPNSSGRWLNVTVQGVKAESSTWTAFGTSAGGAQATDHDPIFLLDNPQGATLRVLGGTASTVTRDTGAKAVVRIVNTVGQTSPVSGNVILDGMSFNAYAIAVDDQIRGIKRYWDATGDDFPRFRKPGRIVHGQTVNAVESHAGNPRSGQAVTGPAYPMLKLSTPMLRGTLAAAMTSTPRPITFTTDSTFAAAVPVGAIIYVETEPLQVTAVSGTSITAQPVDPGGAGYTNAAHASGAYVYFHPENWSIAGAGSPQGAVMAPPGSSYSRLDPASSTTALYLKASGWGNTGWERVQSFPPAYAVSDALTSGLSGWTSFGPSTWTSGTGGFTNTTGSVQAGIVRSVGAVRDIVVQADITLGDTTSNAGAGARGQGGLTFLDNGTQYLRVAWDSNGATSMQRSTRGSSTMVALQSPPTLGNSTGRGVTFTGKVIVAGTTISVYRNGVLEGTATLTGVDATDFATAGTWYAGLADNGFNDGLTSTWKNYTAVATAETAQPVGALPLSAVATATDGDYLVVDGTVSPKTVKTISPPAQTTPLWLPADLGYLAWNGDPEALASSQALTTAGTLYVAKLKTPTAVTASNVELLVPSTAGTALTAGSCFAALYDATGNLLRQSTDQATAWASTGTKPAALSSTVTTSTSTVYVAVWFNGTTSPSFARFATTNASTTLNGKTPASNGRWFTANTGVTTTAPATLGALTAYASNSFWVALS